MTVPSTKGLMLQQVVGRLQALLEAGRITREELEVRLAKEDLGLFDGDKIVPSLWYPVSQNQRLLDLYYVLEGRRVEVMVDLGRESARSILQVPAFRSMFDAASQRRDASAGALLVRLSELVLNFSKWKFHGESLDDFEIDVTEATDYSDHACHSAIGFIEVLALEVFGLTMEIAFERPAPDHIVFRGRTV